MKNRIFYLAASFLAASLIALWVYSDHLLNPPGKKKQKINCVNNLKVIGLAFRLWADDYGNKYPFNVSTNEGGLLETTLLDQNGFMQNPLPYLQKLHDEGGDLNALAVLVCPRDARRKVAKDWEHLTTNNITYQFRASPETRPGSHTVLAVCPVDGNVLYSDGLVYDKQGKLAAEDDGHRPSYYAQQVPLTNRSIKYFTFRWDCKKMEA